MRWIDIKTALATGTLSASPTSHFLRAHPGSTW
jgi:hypothetical protein